MEESLKNIAEALEYLNTERDKIDSKYKKTNKEDRKAISELIDELVEDLRKLGVKETAQELSDFNAERTTLDGKGNNKTKKDRTDIKDINEILKQISSKLKEMSNRKEIEEYEVIAEESQKKITNYQSQIERVKSVNLAPSVEQNTIDYLNSLIDEENKNLTYNNRIISTYNSLVENKTKRNTLDEIDKLRKENATLTPIIKDSFNEPTLYSEWNNEMIFYENEVQKLQKEALDLAREQAINIYNKSELEHIEKELDIVKKYLTPAESKLENVKRKISAYNSYVANEKLIKQLANQLTPEDKEKEVNSEIEKCLRILPENLQKSALELAQQNFEENLEKVKTEFFAKNITPNFIMGNSTKDSLLDEEDYFDEEETPEEQKKADEQLNEKIRNENGRVAIVKNKGDNSRISTSVNQENMNDKDIQNTQVESINSGNVFQIPDKMLSKSQNLSEAVKKIKGESEFLPRNNQMINLDQTLNTASKGSHTDASPIFSSKSDKETQEYNSVEEILKGINSDINHEEVEKESKVLEEEPKASKEAPLNKVPELIEVSLDDESEQNENQRHSRREKKSEVVGTRKSKRNIKDILRKKSKMLAKSLLLIGLGIAAITSFGKKETKTSPETNVSQEADILIEDAANQTYTYNTDTESQNFNLESEYLKLDAETEPEDVGIEIENLSSETEPIKVEEANTSQGISQSIEGITIVAPETNYQWVEDDLQDTQNVTDPLTIKKALWNSGIIEKKAEDEYSAAAENWVGIRPENIQYWTDNPLRFTKDEKTGTYRIDQQDENGNWVGMGFTDEESAYNYLEGLNQYTNTKGASR